MTLAKSTHHIQTYIMESTLH